MADMASQRDPIIDVRLVSLNLSYYSPQICRS